MFLLEGNTNTPRSASGPLALIPETSIFSEWPELLLNMDRGGVGSGAQKEAVLRAGDCQLGLKAPQPCTQSIFHYLEKYVKAATSNELEGALGRDPEVETSNHSRTQTC